MIDYDEAFALVCAAATSIGSETVPIDRAHGRFLAAPVVAQVDSPPADVSAMDGYAIGEEGDWFRVIGASYPGAPFEGRVARGESVRIFTGAKLPEGARRVVVQEIVERDGETMRITEALGPTVHIRRRGTDFAAGQELLRAGDHLGARETIVAAGADLDRIEVGRKPRIALLATGDELVSPGSARSTSGRIPESISYGLTALLAAHGGECSPVILVPDDADATVRAAGDALARADLVVMTGGASVGEKDFAKQAFGALGLEPVFTKVAMKPGKPVWFGHVHGKPVMGLPGNPTSAFVTARLLLAPLVRGMAGGRAGDAVRWSRAILAGDIPGCGDRETFSRGTWRENAALVLSNKDSGAQLTLAVADLLIRQRADTPPLAAGDQVEIVDL